MHGLTALSPEPPPPDVSLQQVQQPSHGAEQQHPVTSAVQLDQQPVQHTQLAALPQQLCLVGPIVRGVAQGGVVAHLAQLHALVVQGGEVVAVGFADAGVEGGEAEGAGTFDPVVDDALVGCHGHMHRQRHLQSGAHVEVHRYLSGKHAAWRPVDDC